MRQQKWQCHIWRHVTIIRDRSSYYAENSIILLAGYHTRLAYATGRITRNIYVLRWYYWLIRSAPLVTLIRCCRYATKGASQKALMKRRIYIRWRQLKVTIAIRDNTYHTDCRFTVWKRRTTFVIENGGWHTAFGHWLSMSIFIGYW